jgi:hypothetical protein
MDKAFIEFPSVRVTCARLALGLWNTAMMWRNVAAHDFACAVVFASQSAIRLVLDRGPRQQVCPLARRSKKDYQED